MREQQDTGVFDFDRWAELARSDPLAFELQRKFFIEAVISSAHGRNRQKLRQIQWKLDRIRDTSATPMAACLRMQEMLWDSVLGDDGLLARLQQLPIAEKPPRRSAQILDFRR